MSKYKAGDMVQIKSVEFLEKHKNQSPSVVVDMYKFANKIFTITETYDHYSNGFWYYFNDYQWHEDWLEPVHILQINSNELENLLNG